LLNRGRLILIAMSIPISIIFLLSEHIFLLIGQDSEVAFYASQYTKSMIVGTFFFGQFDLTKRFLIQLQVSWVPMFAQVITTVLHVFICKFFVIYLDMQVIGAGYAMALTCILQFTSVTILAGFVS
jgi:multidrug resistance protein, MATE family